MQYTYVPIMYDGKRIGSAQIDADRLVVSISDKQVKNSIWVDYLKAVVVIEVPNSEFFITIDPRK